MKIIGMAGNDIIATLTPSDLAALVGETYFDNRDAKAKLIELGLTAPHGYDGQRIVVGATVDLEGRMRRVLELERKHAELKDVASKLRSMATLMDHLGNAVIVPPKTEEHK